MHPRPSRGGRPALLARFLILLLAAAFGFAALHPAFGPPVAWPLAAAFGAAGFALALVLARMQAGRPLSALSGAPAALLAVLWCGVALRHDLAWLAAPSETSAALARTEPVAEIPRSRDGHFRVTAEVNGVEIELLIDTGATLVLLTHRDAAALGLPVADLDYSIPVTTANGKSAVAPVTLDSIRIGGVLLEGIEGAVAEPGRLQSSLLGMSFLEALSETVIRSDRIVLRR